ncbi:MAG TPA: M13 family metallopeptidase [Terriglobia bacterium]|nr:M13 family metallopeptidase [Terriglobia bacterium]
MNFMGKWLLGIVPVSLIALAVLGIHPSGESFASASSKAAGNGQSAAPAETEPVIKAFNVNMLDKNAKACVNLFQFADGEWLAKNPIPPEYPSWGTFNELQERNRRILHQILEKASADHHAPKGSNLQKIGDFYASCMDARKVEAEGAKPLEPEFKRIRAIRSLRGLQAEVARLQGEGVDVLFEFGSTQDEKNSTEVIAGAEQGGLGLPDRNYYTKTDAKSQKIREQYVEHVQKMFELLGDSSPKAASEAKTVMSIETKLAEASMTPEERRDPEKTYHKMELAQLEALAPNLAWPAYFRQVGHPGIPAVDVAQPKFLEEVNGLMKSVPMGEWKTYLRWHLIDAAAPALSKEFVEENFNFNGRVLQGTKKILPRWQRCVRATDRELGFALGKIYVQKYFPPEAKAHAQKMVQNLMAALREDLETLPWMGPQTRQAALAKLDTFMPKIGYPDKWRDYSAFHVTRGPYVKNVLKGNLFDFRRDLNKIGKPVDRTEWEMTPPTVNAYYNPLKNEIVFPAGILQPPFFDDHGDDAANYGGIGAVIGHEMTHGFDDEGRKFDAQGNLKNWWTPQDIKNFDERANCIREQFDSYVAIGKVHENGKLVLGESIADLGGLTLAYKAYEKSLEGKPRPEIIDGFTPEQRFFIAWAQNWAENVRPEFARLLLNIDPHPLPRFRAIGPPSNMPAFAKAFDCKTGDPMVRPPSERCRIW